MKHSSQQKQEFSERLKFARAKQSITQSAIAKAAGVSPASIWQWEHGGVIPRAATAIKLAKALSVSPDFLIHGADSSAVKIHEAERSVTLATATLEDLIKAIQSKGFKVTIETM